MADTHDPLDHQSKPAEADPCKDSVQNSQKARFIETARQLGCDEDEAAFREKLGKIAKAKPTKDAAPEDRS